MPDVFTKVTTKSYGKRLTESVGGVVLGVALFFGSFGMLYWNEGRVDLSDVAKKAEITASSTVDATKNGHFVSISGKVLGSEDIGDGLFLKPGAYLSVQRTAEVYAWVEDEETKTETNTGGSETNTTTYTYKKEWVALADDSSQFQYPEGHINSQNRTVQNESTYAPTITLGAYAVNGTTVDLPSGTELSLTPALVTLPQGAALSGSYLYVKNADPASPEVGDERVSFTVLKEGFDGTAFGKAEGSEILSYTDEDGNTLFRIFTGGHAEALTQLHGEYTFTLWLLRLIGFLMMWFGMQMVIGPLSTLLDILPFLGGASRMVTGAITFVIALALSLVTIVISAILHSILALIVVGLLVIGGVMFLKTRKKSLVS